MTERIVNSAVETSARRLHVSARPGSKLRLEVGIADAHEYLSDIILTPENVVAALDGIVPGLSVSYEPPIDVPKGIGAVVALVNGNRYVRDGYSGSHQPWYSADRYPPRLTDAAIADELRLNDARVLSEGVQP